MPKHRMLGIGVVALALPMMTVAALTTSASAKKAPPNPITCTQLGGTVTFAPPGLSLNGAHMTAKTAITTVTGLSLTCPGAGIDQVAGPLSVTVKNVKDPKVKGQARTYTYDTFKIFTTSTPAIKKSIKTISFTVNGSPVLFKNKVVNVLFPPDCPGEIGFSLSGQVKSGPYNTPEAEVHICLGTDTGTNTAGDFFTDLASPTAVIASAQIDPDESEATL